MVIYYLVIISFTKFIFISFQILFLSHKGPGMKQNQPAASCKLLQSKYQDLHDGHYWFQDEGKTKYCERKGKTTNSSWETAGSVGVQILRALIGSINLECKMLKNGKTQRIFP